MNNVTAIIISFLRPKYTVACIESLKAMYPTINILVGDNGGDDGSVKKVCEKYAIELITLPFDSGVCVARNELMRHVSTDYVLVGDDDFYYTPEAKVDKMLEFLEETPRFDLIGGRVKQDGIIRNYQGNIEFRKTHFQSYPIDPDGEMDVSDKGLRYCPADLTFNYFVARTDAVKQVPWDEEIKVAYEHFSWFYDFKTAGFKAAFSPDPIVIHKPEHIREEVLNSDTHTEYSAFRNRKSDRDRFFGKYGITYTIGMNGQKTYGPDHIFDRRKNVTKHIDFCITTFKRPKALERLLISIAENYPMANVYVADQNEKIDREFYKKIRNDLYDIGLQKRVSIEHLPYDCGLSFARNHLVMTTPNKYKLILDDDMMFDRNTDIEKMLILLESHPHVGIVGARVSQLGHDINFEFTPEIRNGVIYHMDDNKGYKQENGIRFRKTGCVLNFALMRKDLFQYISWDPNLKVTEHLDFYLQMKNVPYGILYTPDVCIDHPPTERDPDYKELRQRDEFVKYLFKKYGAHKIKYLNGQVIELMPDNSIKRYKEKPEI